ncbi:MAG: OB-fold domain-containing protein [Chloroflexota bacterium]
MKTRVPFREGLFEEKGGKGALLGARCRACGQVIFPPAETCPDCLGKDLETVRLGAGGKLYSYTIVHMKAEHFTPPYTVGWIELPEGVRVFGQIRGWQEQPLVTGMDMALSFEKLWDEEDKEAIGYVFRPAGKGGA